MNIKVIRSSTHIVGACADKRVIRAIRVLKPLLMIKVIRVIRIIRLVSKVIRLIGVLLGGSAYIAKSPSKPKEPNNRIILKITITSFILIITHIKIIVRLIILMTLITSITSLMPLIICTPQTKPQHSNPIQLL